MESYLPANGWVFLMTIQLDSVSKQNPVFGVDGYAVITSMNSVPTPSALFVFASGLLGLSGVSREKVFFLPALSFKGQKAEHTGAKENKSGRDRHLGGADINSDHQA